MVVLSSNFVNMIDCLMPISHSKIKGVESVKVQLASKKATLPLSESVENESL